MNTFEGSPIKWPYVTHLVDPRVATSVLPPIDETRPGALMLARVASLGRHRRLEAQGGRGMSLYTGDVFACVLGHRHVTGGLVGVAHCSGSQGHVLGIGGVCGEWTGRAARALAPTVVEWVGRLAGPGRVPLDLSQFRLPPAAPKRGARATAILAIDGVRGSSSAPAAAQLIRSLAVDGHRVAAANLTGVACGRDANLLHDAGAVAAYDVTYAGWPSTDGCSETDLLAITAALRRAMAVHQPQFVVFRVAGGLPRRENTLLLSNANFRDSIDGVLVVGEDAVSRDGAVQRIAELGYHVFATSAESATPGSRRGAVVAAVPGIPGSDPGAILSGALLADVLKLAKPAIACHVATSAGPPPAQRAAVGAMR